MSEDKLEVSEVGKTEGLNLSIESKEDPMSLDYLMEMNTQKLSIELVIATKQKDLFSNVNELIKFLLDNKNIVSIRSVSTGGKRNG